MDSSQAGPSEATAGKTFRTAASGEALEAPVEKKARLLQPLSSSSLNAPRLTAAGLGPRREGAKDVAADAGDQRVKHGGGAAPEGSSSEIAQSGAEGASTAPERVPGDSTGEMDALGSEGGDTTVDPHHVEGDGEGGGETPAMPELEDDAEEALALEEGMTDEIGDQEDEPTYEVLAPTLRAWTSTDRDPRDVVARRRCRPCQLPHPCALQTAPPPIVSFSRPLHSP